MNDALPLAEALPLPFPLRRNEVALIVSNAPAMRSPDNAWLACGETAYSSAAIDGI